MRISVALAFYNGKKYMDEQLNSIREQLGPEDEIIISVDGAEDGSDELLERFAMEDSRIQLIEGPHKGVVRNFENAISHCGGDIIFLADQDDIWVKDKVKKVLGAFARSDVMAILHNGRLVDAQGNDTGEKTLFELRGSRTGILKNLIKNSYVGCCMAFRKELLPVILPIPEEMYMHDYWIGTAAELCGGTGLLKEPLLLYRRHGENVTEMNHGTFGFMVKKRLGMLKCLCLLKRRVRENANQ